MKYRELIRQRNAAMEHLKALADLDDADLDDEQWFELWSETKCQIYTLDESIAESLEEHTIWPSGNSRTNGKT